MKASVIKMKNQQQRLFSDIEIEHLFVSRTNDSFFSKIGGMLNEKASDIEKVWLGWQVLSDSKYLPREYA